MNADQLFNEAFNKVMANYTSNIFYLERDLVYIIQKEIWSVIHEKGLPYHCFHEHTISGKGVDLAITTGVGNGIDPELIVEFKYLPDRKRRDKDIVKEKFNQVAIGDIIKDIDAINRLRQSTKAKFLYAIFVDEGGYFETEYTNRKSPNFLRLNNDCSRVKINDKTVVYSSRLASESVV